MLVAASENKKSGLSREQQVGEGAFVGAGGRVAAPSFFFQAEDGIRVLTVTGVQTCALPIFITIVVGPQFSYTLKQKDVFTNSSTSVLQEEEFENDRSEERRVGKECRACWSPHPKIKNLASRESSRSAKERLLVLAGAWLLLLFFFKQKTAYEF